MSKLIPLTIIAGLGAWVSGLFTDSIFFPGKTSSAGGGTSSGAGGDIPPETKAPLPKNVALTFDQVFNLAKYTVHNFGFMVSPQELTVTAYIESSFRPWVFRDEKTAAGKVWDSSYGLMQTLTRTAQDMYDKGYKAMGVPTAALLKTPEVSMYFGAAYKDWLRRSYPGRSAEWYTRAYNGGPGWQNTQNGPANTAVYYQRFVTHSKRMFGGV